MCWLRLNFVVEGQTEETFVKEVLSPHLAQYSLQCSARCVETSRKGGKKHRGGLSTYKLVRNDLEQWIKQEKGPNTYFTTMFDLYRLPKDFPNFESCGKLENPREKVACLEEALKKDIGNPRFIPYIQLHEFEALLLAKPRELAGYFDENGGDIEELEKTLMQSDSPELIDDDKPPSKRIMMVIPRYEGSKTSAGPILAQRIGICAMREKCPHFDEWLSKLEKLAPNDGGKIPRV